MSCSRELEAYNDLKRRVEITKDARFQANLRLERRQKNSHFAISVLSLFVIILSLIPNIADLTNPALQALLALTIVNSVFIIITTFLEASGNHVHRGEQLHRSARKISSVLSKLVLLEESERKEKSKIEELLKDYQDALDDCTFNHDNIDYVRAKILKPSLFGEASYNGPGGRIHKWARLQFHMLSENTWLAPHLLVVVLTLVFLYGIIFLGWFPDEIRSCS